MNALAFVLILVLLLIMAGSVVFVVQMSQRLTKSTTKKPIVTTAFDEKWQSRESEVRQSKGVDRDWEREIEKGLRAPRRRGSVVGMMVSVFIGIIVVGVLAFFYMNNVPNILDRGMLYMMGPPETWPTVPGEVTGTTLETSRNNTFGASVSFTYTINDRTFNERQILMWRVDMSTAQSALTSYTEGQAVTVYYPSFYKSAGLIEPPSSTNFTSTFLPVTIVFILTFAVALAVWMIINRRKDLGKM